MGKVYKIFGGKVLLLNLEQLLKGSRVAIVVPHFDDEIILAGGLIHKLSKVSKICVFSPSDDKLAYSVSTSLGKKLNYSVKKVLDEKNIDYVITTHPNDVYKEHADFFKEVRNMLFSNEAFGVSFRPKIVLSALHPFFGPMSDNAFIPLSKEDVLWKEKALKKFDFFERNISSIDVVKRTEWVEIVTKFYGLKYNCEYAEAFEVM
jgi:hypothetical protein